MKLLTYTGKSQALTIWSSRFEEILQVKGFCNSLLGTEGQPERASLTNRANKVEKRNHMVLKDAFEKEFADIKGNRNNVWCNIKTIKTTSGRLISTRVLTDQAPSRRPYSEASLRAGLPARGGLGKLSQPM